MEKKRKMLLVEGFLTVLSTVSGKFGLTLMDNLNLLPLSIKTMLVKGNSETDWVAARRY